MLVRLFVLGLLAGRPMTGYEIQHFLQVSRSQQWAGILPGSIYHALKKLAGEGLAELHEIGATGNRTRAVYGITPTGRAELARLLREAWRQAVPHYPSTLYAALALLDQLPREEILGALDEHIGALEAELAAWNAGESAKQEALADSMSDLLRAAFTNGREHLEADLHLLRYLRQALPHVQRVSLPDPAIEEG